MLSQFLYYIHFTKIFSVLNNLSDQNIYFYETILTYINFDSMNNLNIWGMMYGLFQKINILSYPWFIHIFLWIPLIYLYRTIMTYDKNIVIMSRRLVNTLLKDFTSIHNLCMIGLNNFIIFNVMVDPLHTLTESRMFLIYNLYPIVSIVDILLINGLSNRHKHIRLSKFRIAYTILSFYLFSLIKFDSNDLVHGSLLMMYISDTICRVCKVCNASNILIAWRNYMYPFLLLMMVNMRTPSVEYAPVVLYILGLVFLNIVELVKSTNKVNLDMANIEKNIKYNQNTLVELEILNSVY